MELFTFDWTLLVLTKENSYSPAELINAHTTPVKPRDALLDRVRVPREGANPTVAFTAWCSAKATFDYADAHHISTVILSQHLNNQFRFTVKAIQPGQSLPGNMVVLAQRTSNILARAGAPKSIEEARASDPELLSTTPCAGVTEQSGMGGHLVVPADGRVTGYINRVSPEDGNCYVYRLLLALPSPAFPSGYQLVGCDTRHVLILESDPSGQLGKLALS
eukprot:tig00000057_g122.t1